jgi:adenylate cyclase class 2
MNKHMETEVKFYMPDLNVIRVRLDHVGAALKAPRVYERNARYENSDETLTPNGIVLRLRQDSRVRLTYKAPSEQTAVGVTSRMEAEVTVDDYDTMHLILQRLGYHSYVIYEKYRTTYELGAAEIVLDEMPFGTFIEIEGTVDSIEAAITALDLGDQPRILGGYMDLFAQVRTALNLTVHDLTFANFEGVTVPPEVFGRC